MAGRLAGKIAIVTGAGSVGPGWGNGRATAVLFAREGATVVVVDAVRAAAEATAEIIQGEGFQCGVLECDVTEEASVAAMVAEVLARHGRVDVLHNNVGGSIPGGPEEMSYAQFKAQLDLNVGSVFLTCQQVLPVMVRQGAGAIVNVGSVGGARHLGHDHAGYTAGKAGLVKLGQALAVRYGRHGVRVNTVVPGLIDTPLLEVRVAKQKGRADLATLKTEAATRVPLGRRGDGWDIAYAALYLASDEARYVTGTELLVDGGLLARAP